jgi:nucleotide-binding universal stress UspA family protein
MKQLSILVPLDFSDLSKHALPAAKVFAELFEGSITPFHSYLPATETDGPYMLGLGPNPPDEYVEVEPMIKERLDEIAGELIPESLLRPAVVSIGNPPHAIVDTADDYDMIVMSTHGRTGFSRFFLGSVAEKVLRMAHKPVLVVDKESEFQEIKKIMVTTDFSENSHAAFEWAKTIATTADAELELVHVLKFDQNHPDEPEESKVNLRRERLKILVKEEFHEVEDRLTTELIISSDSPHEAILNYTLNNEHDLIVMATLGLTGIDYLMVGSTTANVVRHVKLPVLSINPKKTKNKE